jgi:RNA polymerase-binding protein DksA
MEATATQNLSELSRLEAERTETLEELDHLRADLRNMAEPSADEADVDAYEREKTWALIQTLERKLESIDLAVQAAKNGTYGICEGCGERIERARLEVLPQARLCLECQRAFERRTRRSRL